MNRLSRKNERKHKMIGAMYTLLLLGFLAGLVAFSGQADGLKSKIMEWVNPTEAEAAPANSAPVAMLDHRSGNG